MRAKKRERERAYLALPYIILNRAGFWGKHTSEDQSWRSPTRCPKAEGHILREQIKEPTPSNCPKETADMRSPAKFFCLFFVFFEGEEGKEKESIFGRARENQPMTDRFKFKEPIPCLSSLGILEETWAA